MLTNAAIKCEWASQSIIITAKCHADAYEQLHNAKLPKPLIITEGFTDEKFNFFDRYAAVKVAKAFKQIPADFAAVELYSEDLWGIE